MQEIQERWVRSLSQEDPLEEEMATHSSILAERILWTEEPDRLRSIGSQRVGHDWSDLAHMHATCPQIGMLLLHCFVTLDHLLVEFLRHCSVTKSCLTPCNPVDCSTPGSAVLRYLRVCSNSCPLSWWCCLTISFSVAPFSSCPPSLPASGIFQGVGSSHQMAKVLELHLQHPSFQWLFRVDFL